MDSLAFSDEPLMPHCVMRRPVSGAELGLEDPGELMPRSVESNLRQGGERKREKERSNMKETKKPERGKKSKHLPSVRHDSSLLSSLVP